MKRRINIIVANPAGNITIFVLDKFERTQYQQIATQLLSMNELNGEQVAFVVGEDKMEMCGLEFCGNASRTFALLIAKKTGLTGLNHIKVDVSGSSEILNVAVDVEKNYTKIKMPKPISIDTLSNTPLPIINGAGLVDMDGIIHVILKDQEPTLETFNKIKDYINHTYNPSAMGVMFYDTKNSCLVPVVYVKDVDTTYFEGSCGSGTTATAVYFAEGENDGNLSFTLPQPAGTITATIVKYRGNIQEIYIEGTVELSEPLQVEIDL